ncbi:MAG: Mitomycin resistance protein mcrB [Chlamydiia bacterium]|nr:Mitomycin resistance protein mcrB [Chlamydiia bacterium]
MVLSISSIGKMSTKKLRDLKKCRKSNLELALQDPTDLFHRMEKMTGKRQDPCVWDVFAAIIHEARTGKITVLWEWTAKRKDLQKSGKFKHVVE